jgi:hypothetical protein
MKMLRILTAALFVGMLVSCQRHFLDQTPLNNISDAEYWKTANDLRLYANNYYNTMLPAYASYLQVGYFGEDADQGSDNMVNATYNPNLNGETVVPATGGGWSWTSLRDLNYFMANYSKANDSWSNIAPYVGETLFFRALFYFNMLRTFGDLPWINKPLNVTDTVILYANRLPRNIIADSILSDLDAAISYLPSKGGAEPFRVTKEVATLFASRVALYEGTWEKYHAIDSFGVQGQSGQKYLEKAAALAEALINSGVQHLDNVGISNGYWSVFNQTDYSGSGEVMLWRKYDVSAGIAHHWYLYVPIGLTHGITKSLVDDYLCTDGKPISVSPLYKGDDSLKHVGANRDPRLGQTVYLPGSVITTNRPGGVPDVIFDVPDLTNGANPPTGYELFKGQNTDYAQQSTDLSTQALIYFRYAEALLNFAEAKAELGTLTQADLDKSINLLRDRVNMPHLELDDITSDPNWAFPDLSPVINEVRRERRIELACEGFRHDDIMRWAAAGRLIHGWQPKGPKLGQWLTLFTPETLNKYPAGADGYIEPYKNIPAMANGYQFNVNRNYLWPLPADQLTLNPGLRQNPGW